MKDLLVVVRAGRASLHPEWRYDPTRVDLLISAYTPDAPQRAGAGFEFGGYNKYAHVADLLASGRIDARAYRWLFLVDDDIEIHWPLERLADEMAAAGGALGQPSLAWGSFHSFSSLLQNRLCAHRETSLIEVMCPVFRGQDMAWLEPHFRATRSTWGIDLLYSHEAAQRNLKLVVLDRLTVRHCKEISQGTGAWYAKLRADGVEAESELAAIEQRLGKARPLTLAFAPRLAGTAWLARAFERVKPRLRRLLIKLGLISIRRV